MKYPPRIRTFSKYNLRLFSAFFSKMKISYNLDFFIILDKIHVFSLTFTFFPCTYISSTFYLCSFNIVSIILHCSYSTISLYNLTLIRQTTVTSLNVPKIAVKTKAKDNDNIKIKWRRKITRMRLKNVSSKKDWIGTEMALTVKIFTVSTDVIPK